MVEDPPVNSKNLQKIVPSGSDQEVGGKTRLGFSEAIAKLPKKFDRRSGRFQIDPSLESTPHKTEDDTKKHNHQFQKVMSRRRIKL